MASSKNSEEFRTRLLWTLGGAAITAFAFYTVQKYLKERDELMMMRVLQKQRESEPKQIKA